MQPLLDQEDIAQMQGFRKVFARWLFTRVMERVNVQASMRDAVFLAEERLHVGAHVFDLGLFQKVLLVSIGKAAVPMAQHAYDLLHSSLPLKGVVVGVGDWTPPEGMQYVQGDHPVPYAQSFVAARACLQLMREADDGTLALYLISGGASAMAEAPLDPSISPEDLSAFYRQILYSGLPIGPANVLRKHFSAIKGGRLALAAGAATHCTILVSDVPVGKLDVVGSGPSLADTSTVAECRTLLVATPAFADLPLSIQTFAAAMPETPKSLPSGRLPSACLSLLSSDSLIAAAEPLLHTAGFRTVVDNVCDDWDYRDAASYLVDRAIAEVQTGGPVCIISAGEITVSINGSSGTGGRNQQWALEVARLIDGDTRFVAMSVGSDGIDGNSPAAGAIVDGKSWHRARIAGLDPSEALARFNAHAIFSALSDAITPGPSGNNIRDLRVIFGNQNTQE